MKVWSEIDNNGKMSSVKAIISDNLLNYKGANVSRIRDTESNDITYNNYDTGHLNFKDEDGEYKEFNVMVDGTYITNTVDDISFVVGNGYPYFNDNDTIIEGTIKNSEYEDTEDIIFMKSLKDTVFIDIEEVDNQITVVINTQNK